MQRVSISEIQRNLHMLDNFDIIEVVDKKRHKIKGYFIESKYGSYVKELSRHIHNQTTQQQSLRGVLHEYADKGKAKHENGAWKRHIAKKYQKND